jgi:hypothetical protein
VLVSRQLGGGSPATSHGAGALGHGSVHGRGHLALGAAPGRRPDPTRLRRWFAVFVVLVGLFLLAKNALAA